MTEEPQRPDGDPSFISYVLLYGGVVVLLAGLGLGLVLLLRAGR